MPLASLPHLQHLKIGVKLIRSGKHRNLNFHNHTLNEIAVVLSTGPETLHWAGRNSCKIRRGDVLLIRPGDPHAYENVGEFSVLNFLYDAENLPLPQLDGSELPLYSEVCSPRETRADPARPIARMQEKDLAELLDLSRYLIGELADPRPSGNLYAFGLFISAMVMICRSGITFPGKIRNLPALPALHYINLHFRERIPVEKLVSLTKLSRNTLFRKFRELTGYSPINYQLNKKLEAARELLDNSDMTVGEIAFVCGFCDSNHLIRIFKEKYGCSPGKLRKAPAGSAGMPAAS